MNAKKRILMIDRYFSPDLQATSVLLTDLARALSVEFDVTVLCGPPSSFQNNMGLLSENISVKTIPSFQFNQPNFFERFLIYSSFLLMVPLALFFSKNPDKILVQTSPPLLPFVVSVIARIKKIPYIYACQDLFPGSAINSGALRESWFTWFSEMAHRSAVKHANKVVAIGRDMKDLLCANMNQPGKIEVISNWSDDSNIKPLGKENAFSRSHNLRDSFVVMHSGNFGLVQDFDFLLEVAKELENDSDIRFVFVGNGTSRERVICLAEQMNLKNTLFLPAAPQDKVAEVLSSADLQIVSLKQGLAGYSIPSKTYALLASGSAILGLVEKKSEPARLIEEADCGFVIEKRNAVKVSEIIKELVKSAEKIKIWKKNARAFSDRMKFRERAINHYKQILREV